MSFSMTTEQYRNRQKTVTRRLGWKFLKPGMVLMGVEKCQGIPKGGHVVRMHPLRVQFVGIEQLEDIVRVPVRFGQDLSVPAVPEVVREGFPTLTPREFVDMFCRHNKVNPEDFVTRIEFEHLPDDMVGYSCYLASDLIGDIDRMGAS